MAEEKYTKDEYNYIIFECLLRALAAIEEKQRKCQMDYEELKRHIDIKQRLYSISNEILKLKEKDT